jgi:hypothetical protein
VGAQNEDRSAEHETLLIALSEGVTKQS